MESIISEDHIVPGLRYTQRRDEWVLQQKWTDFSHGYYTDNGKIKALVFQWKDVPYNLDND